VLEFARGERSIFVRKVYLVRFFDDIEKQLRQELENTGVELTIVLGDRGTARFDEAKMTRALHNLTRNAAEAIGPSGGAIVINVGREDDWLVVSVSDTGGGIPTEIEDKLFLSFVTAGKRGGTGLGLPIVKKIVDEHQGAITVTSSPSGATFTIRLPADGPEPARTADPSQGPAPA
jgi:signal transduction histidine kinase